MRYRFAAVFGMLFFGLGGTAVPASATPLPRAALSTIAVSVSPDAVACAAASQCIAVGSYLPFDRDLAQGDSDGDATIARAFVESNTGGSWKQVTPPSAGAGDAYLYAVACQSSASCVAVGSVAPTKPPKNKSASFHVLVERSTGSSWMLQSAPGPSSNSVLDAVSCPSSNSCFAAGYSKNSKGTSLLVERLVGSKWSLVATPAPTGRDATLSGISCPSTYSCIAVGSYLPKNAAATSPAPLGLVLTAGKWKVSSPALAAKVTGSLRSVSCSASAHCVAIGSSEKHGATTADALVVAYTGKWAGVAKDSGSPTGISLEGVSCPIVSTCLASGWSINPQNQAHQPIIVTVHPTTWTVSATTLGFGSPLGISCPSVGDCVATGSNLTDPEVWNWNGARLVEGPSAGCAEDEPCAGS